MNQDHGVDVGGWVPQALPVRDLPHTPLRRPGGYFVELVNADQPRWARPLVLHVTLGPDAPAGPKHRHRRAENTYLVIDGVLEVQTERGTVRLQPHERIVIPPGIGHATGNPSSGPTVFLAMYTHPIDDDFEPAEW